MLKYILRSVCRSDIRIETIPLVFSRQANKYVLIFSLLIRSKLKFRLLICMGFPSEPIDLYKKITKSHSILLLVYYLLLLDNSTHFSSHKK
jgi:TRAP-type C4-dicarboxylate transport system permease large subunit